MQTTRQRDTSSDADLHRRRAEQELNIGLVSASLVAAEAHLELSSLHHRRASELGGLAREPLLRM